MKKTPVIVNRSVEELIPYIRNSRTHSDAQVAQIAASVREFGWTNPVLVDGENGIIAGHGRVLAARKLGMDEVPCIELAGLSDTQRRAYVIADNKLPLHRGRDSIRWAIRMGERVTGGSVYRLSNRMDGGDVLAQRHVFIRPDDTAEELWRRDLAPLGVELLAQTVAAYAEGGYVHGAAQDEALATWEPSIDRPPAYRPDLVMLGLSRPHPWYEAECV